MKSWGDYHIDLGGRSGIEVAVPCPQCSPHRKKPKAKCLSVNTEKDIWCCHHCGWTGSLRTGPDRPSVRPRVVVRPAWTPPEGIPEPLRTWFAQRAIPADVLAREEIALVDAYMPALESEVPCMAFPYRKGGEVVNIKYRTLDGKQFRQVAGAEQALYRLEHTGPRTIVVEGEVDALSCVAAGIDAVVSVPGGAPAPNAKMMDAKLVFLDGEPDPFKDVEQIVLATDADGPGQALAQELARRLGRDRCWLVTWPDGCKDANDVLRRHGAESLRIILNAAEPWPIDDVVTVSQVADEVRALYREGVREGLSTGWAVLDAYYRVEEGQLTVVTGIPSHGKTQFVDALAVNLAWHHGWRLAVCSPESWPVQEHVATYLEKVTGRPFPPGPRLRMSPAEMDDGLQWLEAHLTFIAPGQRLNIYDVLDRATSLVRRRGIRGLIIDPYNEFDHQRPRQMTESEYIGDLLSAVKQWARTYGVHVWLAAHPAKLQRQKDGTYPVPTPYDISGSANWRNRADGCICIWRDLEEEQHGTTVYVQKVRHRRLGRIGQAQLWFDAASGRYNEEMPMSVHAASAPSGTGMVEAP